MRTLKPFLVVIFCMTLLLTSCVFRVSKDNGKHKGWHKNSNNPHNPAH